MRTFRRLSIVLAAFLLASGARAQWVTENYSLKGGWNGIWLSHDASHETIDTLLASQPNIVEIWRWNPLGSTIQYNTSPANPLRPDEEWAVWRRGNPTGSTLSRLTGNAGYLVKVGTLTPAQSLTLPLTGRPLLPRFNGQVTGLSFSGFPISPSATHIQSRFDRFLSFDSVLKSVPRIFNYVGGPLSDDAPKNPVQITQLTQTPVTRGVAYWIEAGAYTPYYGPVSITASDSDALDFGTGSLARTLRVKNVTAPAKNQTVTVTIQPSASVAAPAGQPAVAGDVPLLLRGDLDPLTLQQTYTPFTAPITRTLAPGAEAEIVVYLNRAGMGVVAGKQFQSLLQVSDSLNLTRIDVPVRATSTSLAGLWVGQAAVTTVDQIVGSGATATAIPGPANGSGFPVRLIIHIDATGKATLLQQAYLAANDAGVFSVYTKTTYRLALKTPARVSSASFPLDLVAAGTGTAGLTGSVQFAVPLPHDATTNPFVHSYHPAHDNLNARFDAQLPAGRESYTVGRGITLDFSSNPGSGDLSMGSSTLGGRYSETVTGLRSAPISAGGPFIIKRVSDTPNLITQ